MKLTDLGKKDASNEFTAGRIRREHIPGTIKYVSELLGIPKSDLHVIGSTGKIEDSGDIDLAVDINKYNPENLDKVMRAHGFNGKYNKSLHVGSYVIPVKGENAKGYVQVDLMYTPNPEWAKFSYFSPGEGSKYKGAVRTVLLGAVAAVLNEPGVDYFEHLPKGELAARAGRTLDLHQGLRRIYQHRPKKVKGEGYHRNMKTISPEDFQKMYPGVNLKNGQTNIDNPEKVVKTLFGRGVTPDDVQSAEQVLHLIKSRFPPETQSKIWRIAAGRLKHLKDKVRIPPEIANKM